MKGQGGMRHAYFMRIFPGKNTEAPARKLYEQVILQSRCEAFYTILTVPDSVDGRFELLLLHLALLLRRLRKEGQSSQDLMQTIFDTFIFDLDQSLRESGVGDLKVGPNLKAMGEAFYGRSKVYDDGLSVVGDASLKAALVRNVYGTAAPPPAPAADAFSNYVRRVSQQLDSQSGSTLMKGRVTFPSVPDRIEE